MATIPKEVFRNVRRIQIRTTRAVNDIMAGAYHSAFKGRGMEFEEVREYIPGDEVRSIDWNVTARMNHTYIKNFREERELTVLLVVDVSGSAFFGSTPRTKRAFIAELAAVLALSAIRNNDKVGLLLFSDRIEKYLPPTKGVRHVLRVIRELLAFEPEGKGTDIAQALAFLGRVHRKRGICFLISDFMADNFNTELGIISKRHDLIAMSVSDPMETELPDLGLVSIQDLESGEERLIDLSAPEGKRLIAEQHSAAQEELKSRLNRVGAGYMSLRTDQPYAEPLSAYLEKRKRGRARA